MNPFLIAVSILAACTAAWFAWAKYQSANHSDSEEDDEEEHQMLSFVALLKEPRYLEPIILATAAQNAWGVELGVGEDGDENPDGFIVGETPSSFIMFRGRAILVNSFSRTYVDDPEDAAGAIADMRLRELFGQHRAWISCDALGVESFEDLDEVRTWCRLLGRLLAELLDEDCLAIYVPHSDQLFPNMEETWEMLRSEDPLEALHGEMPVPVIEIQDDDPRMIAAVQKARDTWGDFESAFERREGENFGVKAPISGGGNTEFIWITVEAIENGVIYGKLANEPMDLGPLKIGSQVRAKLADLNDWAYIDSKGDPQGLYTVSVLAEAERKRQQDLE